MPTEIRIIQQAYRFALDPTPRQARMLSSHAGAARFAYNWGNARIIAALDAQKAEKAAGGKAETKTPGHFELCRQWTAWKDEHAHDPEPAPGERRTNTAWVSENFVGTYQAALRDAAKAWSDFFKSAKGERKGRRLGRPRFKKRGKARDSFQVHGGTLRVVSTGAGFRAKGAAKGATRDMVVMPKIGPVFLHESARKLRRRTDKGTARIVRGTVARESDGRWYIALTAEVQREVRTGPSARQRKGGAVGVDFGVRELATLSDGTAVPNPRHLEGDLGRLARAQRALSRCEPGSRRRAKAVRRVGRLHARVRAERLDSLHKATSGLVHGYERIVVEGFDVQETARYRRAGKVDPKKKRGVPGKVRADRNRALADTGIGMARWQLESKAAWYGCQVTRTDKHALTGRTCSACGQAKAKPVPPAEEYFTCEACGTKMPRRLNTARVLLSVVVAPSTGETLRRRSGAAVTATVTPAGEAVMETLNAPGGGVRPLAARGKRHSPAKGEASTRPRPG
jgi:putative transposase